MLCSEFIVIFCHNHENLLICTHIRQTVTAKEKLSSADIKRLIRKSLQANISAVHAKEHCDLMSVRTHFCFLFGIYIRLQLLHSQRLILRNLTYTILINIVDSAVAYAECIRKIFPDARHNKGTSAEFSLTFLCHTADSVVCFAGIFIYHSMKHFRRRVLDFIRKILHCKYGKLRCDIPELFSTHTVTDSEYITVRMAQNTVTAEIFRLTDSEYISIKVIFISSSHLALIGSNAHKDRKSCRIFLCFSHIISS